MPGSLIASAGRPPAREAGRARELLMDAATALFASHGVGATSFATVARKAGFTPAMLHYYFKNRQHLLDAVVDERFVPFIELVWDPVKPDMQPLEAIPALVGRLLDGIEKMPWIPSLWVREVLNEGGALRERVLRRLPFGKAQGLGRAIARSQAMGQLNPGVDPLLTVSSTVGLVMLHAATLKTWAQSFHRAPMARQTLERHLTGLLLDGLRCRPKTRIRTAAGKQNIRTKGSQ